MILKVQVKPYVKKFIVSRYRQEIWEISRQDRIGKMFYHLLEPMPKLYKRTNLELGDLLLVEISDEYATRQGCHLPVDSILEFNDSIYLELIEEIAIYAFQVKNKVGLKKYKELYVKHKTSTRNRTYVLQDPDISQYFEKREVIYDILKLYGITEDDLPFDTVKKAWQRLKLPMLNAS
ncbi:hypothetical protein EOD41_10840 [Mucilaginibacter limnophilus]|uniref:Uncharacterized protein n=1 Tax=Mucilaginibacter limnophilus TaxID=1932778 RepID=A0A3S2WYI9_9SPHI|nr:hypothetical protein [Mucilaginibacter limnophilus]RVU01102.1 hypothetical protein EOD41_10840 [Mucilaginibacter limnophilus]